MKTTYISKPKEVDTILKVFTHAYNDNMHLAGGAVRNQVWNVLNTGKMYKPVKDWDLFLEVDASEVEKNEEELRILADRNGWGFKVVDTYGGLHSDKILSIVKLNSSINNVKIDVMLHVGSIDDTIAEFSVSASQVYLDSRTGTIRCTDAFVNWTETDELQFSEHCSQAYKEKITEYFKE